MIVHVPVRHRIDILPKRARKAVRTFAETTMPFEVVTASDGAAPVALVDDGGVRVRSSGGRLWKPLEGGGTLEAAVAYQVADLVRSVHLDGRASGASLSGRLLENPGREGNVVVDHSSAVAGVVAAWIAQELLVVDGQLHVRARSPLLERLPDGCWDMNGSPVDFLVSADEPEPIWFLDAARLDALRAAIASVASSVPEMRRLASRARFEVVDRAALDRAASFPAANADLTLVRDDLMRELLADVPKGGEETRALRRAFERARFAMDVRGAAAAVSDPASLEDAVEAMRDVVRTIPAPPESSAATVRPGVRREVPFLRRHTVVETGGSKGPWGIVHRGDMVERAGADVPSYAAAELSLVAETPEGRVHRTRDGTWLLEIEDAAEVPEGTGMSGRSLVEHHRVKRFSTAFLRAADLLSRDGPARGWVRGGALAAATTGRPVSADGVKDAERSATVEAFLAACAADVDGRLFFVVPEPVLRASRGIVEPTVALSFSKVRPSEMPMRVLRLDRSDEGGGVPGIRIVDPSLLAFDEDAWNLKAAMRRIVSEVDGRIRIMSPAAALAVQDAAVHLETWAVDPAAVSHPDEEARFVEAAGILLDALSDPIHEGIGSPEDRETASSLQVVLERRVPVPPSDDGDGRVWEALSM